MKFEQSIMVPTSRSKLWDLLMDVARLGRCFPGVEQVTSQDGQNYQGAMKVRVGPVRLTVEGTIVVLDRDQDRWHASLRLEGSDRRVGGGVRGTLDMDLQEVSTEETELVIHSEMSFMGKLGELGQTVVRRKADKVIQEFARNLKQDAASRP